MAAPNNITIKGKGIEDIAAAMRHLAQREVLVGYPATTSEREPAEGEPDVGITNAAIAYINENGDPDLGIPARPHLGPAIAEMQPAIEKALEGAARAAVVSGNTGVVDARLGAIGQRCADAVRRFILNGLSPPLADATIAARARRGNKGAIKEQKSRAEGNAPGSVNTKPLFDTGALYRSLTYVLRMRNQRDQ